MTRLLSKITGIAALTLALQGCAYNLRGTPDENEVLRNKNNAVLDNFFTPAVAQELKQVPVHYATFDYDQMVGGAVLSGFRAMLAGVGYESITVFNIEKKGKIKGEVMLHENIHHAQQKGRISRDEFNAAWRDLQTTKSGTYVCKSINTLIHLKYGFLSSEDDLVDERMAFMPYYVLKYPDSISERMKRLYAGTLQSWVLSNEPINSRHLNLLEK